MRFYDLIRDYYSVSIIGMCKNAGKTTVLNRIIHELIDEDVNFAITSIGRDGEGSDIVTGTNKPGIYVRSGTIVATAFEMLKYCDVTKEILDATGISTPMGEVIIFKSLSDGAVQIAGPSLVDQLSVVKEKFRQFGAQKVLIDGALSRKSLCTHNLSDATILATGASFNKDMDIVAEETGYISELLTLPVFSDTDSISVIEREAERGCLVVFDDFSFEKCDPKQLELIIKKKNPYIKCIYFGGAVSDTVLKPLVMSGISLEGINFVAFDGSKFLLSKHIFEKIYIKGGAFSVLKGVNPVAITVNPFSAYGFHFDKDRFIDAVRNNVSLPVFNAEDM